MDKPRSTVYGQWSGLTGVVARACPERSRGVKGLFESLLGGIVVTNSKRCSYV